MSHYIQQQIISRLKNADSLRYGQLQVADCSRDLFNYHLRELVANGVVTKLPHRAGYTLSDKGQRRVADVHHTSDQAQRLFKVNPLLIVVDHRKDGIFVVIQQRTAQPDYGTLGIPGGTIVKAEPLLEGATRKLLQETGLTAQFSYIATTRRILYRSDVLFADVFFPICLADSWSGSLVDTTFGENSWAPIEEAIAADTRIELIGRVLRAIQANNLLSVQGAYYEQIVRE